MLISLSSQYHDAILRAPSADESDYGVGTHCEVLKSDSAITKLRTLLTTISNCEVVLEMASGLLAGTIRGGA